MGSVLGLARAPGVLLGLWSLASPPPSPAQAQETLTVFAAASLTDAFSEIGQRFEAAHPGVRVEFNFAGSQALATQIEQGARADVFASADQRWMQHAGQHGLLAAEPRTFARNRLVVVVPRSNPGSVTRVQDLARPGLKLVLAGTQVPAGAYSREAIRRLAAQAGFPAQYEQQVLANLVSEEENVKAVLAKVQLGEADAGIVYRTDVTPSAAFQVTMLDIPDTANPIAEYPIAPVAGGSPEQANAFITFVLSPAGQEILAAKGFMTGPLAVH